MAKKFIKLTFMSSDRILEVGVRHIVVSGGEGGRNIEFTP